MAYTWPNMVCYYCGCEVHRHTSKKGESAPKNRFTRDHLIPRCRGGLGQYVDPSNIVTACAGCNEEKGKLTVHEYKAVLAFRAGHKELFKLWYAKFREEKDSV